MSNRGLCIYHSHHQLSPLHCLRNLHSRIQPWIPHLIRCISGRLYLSKDRAIRLKLLRPYYILTTNKARLLCVLSINSQKKKEKYFNIFMGLNHSSRSCGQILCIQPEYTRIHKHTHTYTPNPFSVLMGNQTARRD